MAADFTRLRDRVIADGIAEVERVYEGDDPRRAGAIEGFELCRTLSSRTDFARVLEAREKREHRMRLGDTPSVVEKLRADGLAVPEPITVSRDDYWKHRYGTLQVEWVLNCLFVAGWAQEGDMLSARAARKVGEILG